MSKRAKRGLIHVESLIVGGVGGLAGPSPGTAAIGVIIRITSVTGTTVAIPAPGGLGAGVNTFPTCPVSCNGPALNMTGANTIVLCGTSNLPNGSAISGLIQADDGSFQIASNTVFVNGTKWTITFNAADIQGTVPQAGTTACCTLTVTGTQAGSGAVLATEMMEIQLQF